MSPLVTHLNNPTYNEPKFTEALRADLEKTLHAKSARDIVVINLAGKSDVADYMIVASGTSTTHVGSLADYVGKLFADRGIDPVAAEGMPQNDWVLVDTPYVIVHIFKPEVRAHYQIEKMWQADFSVLEKAETRELVH